jgi:type IV secretory pathway VirB2 component (pilin)
LAGPNVAARPRYGSASMEMRMNFNLVAIETSHGALPAAVDWIAGTLLSSVATGVAVLAVAFLGFGMLFGHLDWRTGLRVILGAFILFGAPTIAQELAALAQGNKAAESDQVTAGETPQRRFVPDNSPAADPYAGAGMPKQ